MYNSICSSCGARIVWARTPAGKAIPLDPTPHPNGNLALLNGLAVRTANPEPGHPHYKSHFATCPNAARHRKRKETSP